MFLRLFLFDTLEIEFPFEAELTEEEREENVRLLKEIVEAEFPPEEMEDPTFRDKVCALGLGLGIRLHHGHEKNIDT